MKNKIILGIIIAILLVAVVVEGVIIFNQSKETKTVETEVEEKQEEVEEKQEDKKQEDDEEKQEDKKQEDDEEKQEDKKQEDDEEKQEDKKQENKKPEDEKLIGEKLTLTKKYNEPEDDELVYTYLKAEIITKYDGLKYVYEIPQININSKEADKINKEILQKYNEILSDMYEQQFLNLEAEGLKYRYCSNDDVLSLIMTTSHESAALLGSEIYNINIETGEKLTNKKVLEVMDITESEFRNKLADAIENLDIYSDEEIDEDFREEQLNKTLKLYEEKQINEIKMYINVEGNITASLNVFATVGGEEASYIIDLETGNVLNV